MWGFLCSTAQRTWLRQHIRLCRVCSGGHLPSGHVSTNATYLQHPKQAGSCAAGAAAAALAVACFTRQVQPQRISTPHAGTWRQCSACSSSASPSAARECSRHGQPAAGGRGTAAAAVVRKSAADVAAHAATRVSRVNLHEAVSDVCMIMTDHMCNISPRSIIVADIVVPAECPAWYVRSTCCRCMHSLY